MQSYESHRSRLRVAADDFGVSPRANRNTLLLISLGKIDRVGIMSLGSISPKEVAQLVSSGVKLDIHLDILHEFHTSRRKRTSALWRSMEFVSKILMGKLSAKKVEKDWRRQIESFIEIFGKSPDGINSHEHVHFFPLFFRVATSLQQEYSIPYIRFGDSLSMPHHTIVSHILHWMRIFNKKYFFKSGSVSSQVLLSLDWIDDPDKFLDNLPEGVIEIACHPELAEDFVKIKKYF
jgi:predicted glycoside hydrolase/deacetylase ChbG (UPF0249 family)